MKPGFALTLAHDGVTLLQRSPRGWLSVGEVALDDPAFDSAVAGLRTTALTLAPDAPLTTKLVIPNSELLFTAIEVPGPDPEARRQAIRAALEGMTPYNVDELTFDWSGSGHSLNVAVVARETLSEAEDFASRHGFNPVSFVAQAEDGKFIGEPFFGETSCAAEVIGKGDKLERDLIPIQVVGRAERPTGQTRTIFGSKLPFGGHDGSAPPSKAPSDATSETVPPADNPRPPAAQSAPPTQELSATPAENDAEAPEAAKAATGSEAEQESRRAHSATGESEASTAEGAETDTPQDAQSALFISRRRPADEAHGDSAEPQEQQPASGKRPDDAPVPDEVDADSPPASAAHAAAPAVKAAADTAVRTPLAAEDGTRHGPGAPAAGKGSGLMTGLAGLGTRARKVVSGATATTGKSTPSAPPDSVGKHGRTDGAKPAAGKRAKVTAGPAERGPTTPSGPASDLAGTMDKPAKPNRRGANAPRARKSDTPELITPPKPRPTLAADAAKNEAEAMTIFGARRHEQPAGGLGRLGLVIATVVALAAGGAAVWAGYFLFSSGTDNVPEIIASVDPGAEAPTTAPDALLPPVGDAPGVDDNASTPADDENAEAMETDGAGPQLPSGETARDVPPTSEELAAGASDAGDVTDSPVQTDPLQQAPFNVDQAIAEALDDVAQSETPAPLESLTPDSAAGLAEGPAVPGAGTPRDDPAPDVDSTPPPPSSTPAESPSGQETVPAIGAEQITAATPEVAGGSTPQTAESAESSATEGAELPPREMTRTEYEAAYEETGIWPYAPEVAALPRPGSLGDLRDPLTDTAPPAQPPGSPGEATRADSVPTPPAPPAPFEPAAPADDADTPEAPPPVTQPEVTVTAGAPPVSPPLRRDVIPRLRLHEGAAPIPQGATPLPRPAGPSPDTGVEQGMIEDVDIQRAADASLRPTARPSQSGTQFAASAPAEETAPVAAASPVEAESQGAASPPAEDTTTAAADVRRASLAADALRPAPRPAAQPGAPGTLAMQQAAPGSAEAVRVALSAPDAATPRPRARLETEAAREPADTPQEPLSALVVARSPQPGLRPAGFAGRAARLQEQSAPAQTTQNAQTPARSAAAASPSIPTSASVARQATSEGAINLRQMNLIGVFGSESDRRALIRMSNGQVVSVRVGDRLDGGQVAAIGASELRYIKNGRNNVLRVGES